MKLIILTTSIVLVLSTLHTRAGESPFQAREPLPWNLLENGGFERDGAGLFAVGLSERDRENPASGDASGRIEIPAGKTTLLLRISNGLRLEKDKDYLVAGRMRTALASPGAEAKVQAELLNAAGGAMHTYSALRLSGTTPWHMFSMHLRGDGNTALRFSLEVKGAAGERVWLDDLYVGRAHVDLSWQTTAGSGLLQAAIADGMQFEFPIPAQSHVMGVFRNGKRLLETQDCEILYGAQVVRLFETPARGEHISIVLRSTLGKLQVPALPLHYYAIFSKAGTTGAWLSDTIADFKAPNVDYAVLEREMIELPSIEGLPTEWNADSARAIGLKANAPGRYSLRLRNEKNVTVAHLAESVPLAAGVSLQTEFNGCDDSGAALPPGQYVWDVVHRPLYAFSQAEEFHVGLPVRKIWRSNGAWMMLTQQVVQGRGAYVVSTTDDSFKEGERKAVIFAKRIDAFVEARPGVYFYLDMETWQLNKFENGAAKVFPKSELNLIGQTVSLAPYETAAGPGVFVGYSRRGETTGAAVGATVGRLLKLDANGEAVSEFGEQGFALDSEVSAPVALEALEDGGVLVAEAGASARLKRLDSKGSPRKEWRGTRGGELTSSARLEESEEIYSLARPQPKINAIYEGLRSANGFLRAPTGEILVASKIEGDQSREIQIYSPRGEFIGVIGRGPKEISAVEAPGYPRLWNTSGTGTFQNVKEMAFDARGDLFVFDDYAGLVKRWLVAPRISNQALTIQAVAKAEPPAKRAIDPLPEAFSPETLKQRYGLTVRTVDFVDLAVNGAGRGLRDDGTSSVVRKPGLRPYRVSGAEHCSWFRAQMRVAQPGVPHLLVVEYPDDVQRRTMLALCNEGISGVEPQRLEAGYATGGAQVLSGKERYFTMIAYPRGTALSVEFLSFLQSGSQTPVNALYGAAASRVWLLELDATLPENPIEEPLAGEKRSIGEHRSGVDALVEEFGLEARNATDQAAWPKLFGKARLLSAWLGFNGLDQVALSGDSARLYPSAFFTKGSGSKETTTQETLNAANGSSDAVSFTFYGLSGTPPNRPELKGLGLVNEHGHADAKNLSLVYPEVQQYFRDVIVEFAEKYKDSPRFAGVTIHLDPHAPPLFGIPGNLEVGFETASLKAFEAASKRVIAGETLSEHVASLKTTLREDWSAWRSGVVRDWVLSVRDALKKIRPDLLLRLNANAADTDPRFHGFDAALYKDQDGIRVFDAPRDTEFLFTTGDGQATWKDLKPEMTTEILEFNHGVGRASGFLKENAASVLVPNKEHIPGALVAAFVRKNPRSILLQSWARGSVGCELELREFARAFRSLPFAPAEELKGAGALRVYRYGGKGAVQYLAVVNPTDGDVSATVTVVDGPAVTTVRDLVGGKDIGSKPGAGGIGFEAVVPAGNMRTYRLGK